MTFLDKDLDRNEIVIIVNIERVLCTVFLVLSIRQEILKSNDCEIKR